MSITRGNHWKRRLFRQVICLGTVPSILAGALCAAPPSLPGLPTVEEANPVANERSLLERPRLLPVPTLPPGGSLNSGNVLSAAGDGKSQQGLNKGASSAVNIRMLPGLPASVPAAVNAMPAVDSMARGVESSPSKATVTMKMQGPETTAPQQSLGLIAPPVALTPTSPGLPAIPMTIANEKARMAGPVKLSIGDDGIVDHGIQRPLQEAVVASRAPELVKPKRFSVASQPVVLAQAAEIQPAESVSSSALPTSNPEAASRSGADVVFTSVPAPSLTAAADRNQSESVADLPAPEITPSRTIGVANPSLAAAPPQDSSLPGSASPAAAMPANIPSEAVKTATPTLDGSSGSNVPQDSTLRQFALRTKPERLYEIESRGTYSIDVPFAIAYVVSLDQTVCSVFNNGKSLTLVGGAAGNTRVAVASAAGEARVIEVNVLPVGQQFSRPQSEIDQVRELISKVFPDARIHIVSLPTGEVEVKGTTTSESDARKILELVRKVCLVPVHDRLKAGR